MAGNLKDCINESINQGWISQEWGEQLKRRYDVLARQAIAPQKIREALVKEMEGEALHRDRVNLKTITKDNENQAEVMAHNDGKSPMDAVFWKLEHFGEAKFDDVVHKRKAILASTLREIEAALHEFRKGAIAGDYRRQMGDVKARLENIIRERAGQDTGDVLAKQLGEVFEKAFEELRVRFNDAGGAIGELERWIGPQIHNVEALMAARKPKWISDIVDRLDGDRMRHPLTGEKMLRGDLLEALDYIYDNIIDEHWREEAGTGNNAALYNRRLDHRFLHFKTADDWLWYQREYGGGDPFAVMIGHIDSMSRDIALMELLGPNPRNQLEKLIKFAMDNTPKDDINGLRRAKIVAMRAREMYDHISGSAAAPVDGKMAGTLVHVRNLLSATSLGSAVISALTDTATNLMTRAYTGIPVTKHFASFVQSFSEVGTREAVRSDLILDSALSVLHEHARLAGALGNGTWSAFINDRVLTYSGLQAWTQAGKHAFGRDFEAFAADMARYSLDEMRRQSHWQGGAFARTLDRHGITAKAWDAIRASDLYEPKPGATFLRPKEITAKAGRDLADKYIAMILRETRYAVPEATVRSRSLMVGTNQPGTLIGEALRSAGQFKAFGVAIMMLHGGRIAYEFRTNKFNAAAYAGALLITSTLFGALAIQLKEIINGRDPRELDMTKEGIKFWGAAMLQGGGLGIYGDFLFSELNRFGGGLAGTVAGPLTGRMGDLLGLTAGNVVEAVQGKKTHVGREAVKFLQQATPGQSLWFLRMAWERLLFDQLQYLADPEAHIAFHRRMQHRKTEYGQDYWWRPGETTPRRGPDMGAMTQ